MDYGQASENGQTDSGQTDNSSSNIDIKFKSPVAVRDVLAVSIARRQNAATNGRLFCVMLFCVCLLLWLFSTDNFFLWLAMFSTLPVAGAVVADNLAAKSPANLPKLSSGRRAHGALHATLCGINTGVPVAVFILILLNIG
ncbi:hypothetical protein IB237_24255 [Agrobacterium sp. AGB01]|uniref:hypothetical protein n=1 Tax=Agrobacterium sp. AGB01 TaxID=2769302 RepID=UPI0017812FCA|nr:hypothetical protein [Agrobacterium sp. AGB01]MBD9390319.1 hypothetical protein [Agrobacterium sp. AGB01]